MARTDLRIGFTVWLLAAPAALPQSIQIEHDGAGRRISVSGTLPAAAVSRIISGGDLTVRGTSSKDIRYAISMRAMNVDDASARRMAETLRVHSLDGQLFFPQSAAVRIELPRNTPYLSLFSPGGAIDASGIEGSVRADSAAGKITLDRITGDVEVHSSGGGTVLGSIGGMARCYSGAGDIRAVKIDGGATFETGGGDIQLGECGGPVRAVTAAGAVRIGQAGGPVFAGTKGGPIAILQAFGMVTASSAGGPIDIGQASSVQCQSASGAIRLNNVAGRLHAAADRGSIVAEILSGHPLADSFLSTRSGDITVFIPSDTGVTIRAETGGPHSPEPIVSDYSDLTIRRTAANATAQGRINGGGPLLRITDWGGRIEIKKK